MFIVPEVPVIYMRYLITGLRRFAFRSKNGQISTLAVEVFRYIQTNAERFQVLLGENNHFGFHKRLKLFFVHHFGEKMVQNKTFFQGLTIQKDYLSSLATSAFLGLVEQWLICIFKSSFL